MSLMTENSEAIHLQCSGGAHPRPTKPPHLRGGALPPPLMSTSGLPINQLFTGFLLNIF